jgi:hypothetical protein
MDGVQRPQHRRVRRGRSIEDRRRHLDQVDGIEDLVDRLEHPAVRRTARGPAALDDGEPRRDETVSLREIGRERRRFRLTHRQLQQG